MAASKASAQAEVTFDMDSPCFSSDEFRMYQFKMKRCPRARPHDWTQVGARMGASSVSRLGGLTAPAAAACCHARVSGRSRCRCCCCSHLHCTPCQAILPAPAAPLLHPCSQCPFAHPGEKAKRRDPKRFNYSGSACPEFRRVGVQTEGVDWVMDESW